MIATPSQLRLKIDARFAGGDAPLYVLALDTVSIVAVLFEFAQQFAVTLSESFLEEAEYAAAVVEMLVPLASTSRLLPPGTPWRSHATLRLHTQKRLVEGSDETEEVVLINFSVHERSFDEELDSSSLHAGGKMAAAYEEEARIMRSLDGFVGDAAALLERLKFYLEHGAVLARTQLFYQTAERAKTGLLSIYAEDPIVQKRIDEFATWLLRKQGNESLLEETVTSAAKLRGPAAERRH